MNQRRAKTKQTKRAIRNVRPIYFTLPRVNIASCITRSWEGRHRALASVTGRAIGFLFSLPDGSLKLTSDPPATMCLPIENCSRGRVTAVQEHTLKCDRVAESSSAGPNDRLLTTRPFERRFFHIGAAFFRELERCGNFFQQATFFKPVARFFQVTGINLSVSEVFA